MHTLTRVLAFHARHRMHVAEWTEAENQACFGWTADPPGHGHLYRIEVTVAGPLAPRTGMIVDLALLDRILAEEITGRLAGQHLNVAIPEIGEGRFLPTCEAVAAWCASRVAARLPEMVTVHRVRVAEDETLWGEWLAD